MGSFSRPRPFSRINYTVDTCVVSATKTSFFPLYFASETPFSRLGLGNNKTHLW